MSTFDPLIFFGTPEFALPTLARLVTEGYAPGLVVSRPAKPSGRGRELHDPPVARWAKAHGIAVRQPAKAGDPEFLIEIESLRPQVAVVVAYGQIFGRRLLQGPVYGCINLHASLLPRHRGAAPIQASILAGDETTGVSTMLMAEGLDTGPILLQRELAIGKGETAGELSRRLAELGAEAVLETLRGLEQGEMLPRAQDSTLATYAPRLTKEVGHFEWTLPARTLLNQLRAYTPWPGMATQWQGGPVKVLRAEMALPQGGDAPGTVVAVERDRVRVRCGGNTALDLLELQRPGRRALAAGDFANGERLRPGQRFS
ncbi:MAG: methionyl-tRNA formyltransferase [Acidobacteriota bacterium]